MNAVVFEMKSVFDSLSLASPMVEIARSQQTTSYISEFLNISRRRGDDSIEEIEKVDMRDMFDLFNLDEVFDSATLPPQTCVDLFVKYVCRCIAWIFCWYVFSEGEKKKKRKKY